MHTSIDLKVEPIPNNAVFSKKHPIQYALTAKNNLSTAQKGIVQYDIIAANEDTVHTGKMWLEVAAGKKFKERFIINFSRKGNYRIDIDISFPDYTEKLTGKLVYQ